MREHRLLDRIRIVNRHPERRVAEDHSQMIHSIRNHLQRILNTRQGNVSIAEDFGVPDFTNFSSTFTDANRGLERRLRQTIQKFEPRLQGVRVEFYPKEDHDMSIMFHISARLMLDNQKVPVTFESRVDADGRIVVRR